MTYLSINFFMLFSVLEELKEKGSWFSNPGMLGCQQLDYARINSCHAGYGTSCAVSECPGSEIRNIIQSSFRATPAKAGGDPESRNFKSIWIPASAGMTARA
jgi:hypothetical protein